jgi:hypothetical protein
VAEQRALADLVAGGHVVTAKAAAAGMVELALEVRVGRAGSAEEVHASSLPSNLHARQ